MYLNDVVFVRMILKRNLNPESETISIADRACVGGALLEAPLYPVGNGKIPVLSGHYAGQLGMAMVTHSPFSKLVVSCRHLHCVS